MAIFRKVHVSFWKDDYVEGLNKDGKFLFLYLLTNDRATQCGIYEITLRQMAFDTGFTIPELLLLLEQFEKDGKIIYNAETKEIALKNWAKYNDSTSPKVKKCTERELKNVKDITLIEYLYSIDTVLNKVSTCINTHSQEEEEEYKDKEEYKEPISHAKNSFNSFPTEKELSVELPEIKIGAVQELMKITKQTTLSKEKILSFWMIFKTQNFTGKKFYGDFGAITSHFINWMKTQNVKHESNGHSQGVLGGRKILTT